MIPARLDRDQQGGAPAKRGSPACPASPALRADGRCQGQCLRARRPARGAGTQPVGGARIWRRHHSGGGGASKGRHLRRAIDPWLHASGGFSPSGRLGSDAKRHQLRICEAPKPLWREDQRPSLHRYGHAPLRGALRKHLGRFNPSFTCSICASPACFRICAQPIP